MCQIGEGNFGIVYKGNFNGTTVAIKQIRPEINNNPKERQQFLDEIAINMYATLGCLYYYVLIGIRLIIMAILSSLVHPNIVLTMGVAVDPEDTYYLVSEFCQRGSLEDVMDSGVDVCQCRLK